MRFHKLLIIVAALFAVSVISCKKDEEEALPYLTGQPEFDLPLYGKAGDTFTFKGKGVTDDDGNSANYYWYATPVKNVRDTTDTYTLTVPDTLCTINMTCGAFKKGYYGTTTTKNLTIIKSGRSNGSITGLLFDVLKDFVFKDERDGHEYWCTTIGDKDWFMDNLALTSKGHPLENCPATAEVFGMFYNWDEAMTSCPEGWRVSTLKDWADAAKEITGEDYDPLKSFYSIAGGFMGDIHFNGEKMWEYWPEVKITNKTGLSMMPLGYALINSNGKAEFNSMNGYSAFWVSDEKDSDKAYYRYMYEQQPDVFLGSADKKSFAASVRCVRDHI